MHIQYEPPCGCTKRRFSGAFAAPDAVHPCCTPHPLTHNLLHTVGLAQAKHRLQRPLIASFP